MNISLEESIEILDSIKINKQIKKVKLLDALNKVSSQDIYSKINNPPFNKSAMDGYALKIDENTTKNQKFKVVGTVFAGEVFNKDLNENEAVKIMTGAKIPPNLNAVIKKEDVLIEGEYIILNKNLKENENICEIGEDVKINQLIIKKHTKLNYANIGILASLGINEVLVYESPKISLVTTGDEVVDIENKLEDGKIYNSNKYSILGRLFELGYSNLEEVCHITDDFKEIGEKIKDLSKKSNLIITTGGVSVGDKDYIKEAIKQVGGEILFHKVKIKPGSAVLVSKIDETLIISLSGNPNASLTTFELLVKPMICKLSGEDKKFFEKEIAILNEPYNKKSNVRRFLRGKTFIKDGVQMVSITQKKSGNGILSSTIDSNCLIDIKKGNEGLLKGEKVEIIKIW